MPECQKPPADTTRQCRKIGRESAIAPPVETPARARRRKSWIDEQSPFWYRLCVVLVGLLLRFWIRCYRATNAEKVPHGGAFVIANHASGLDPFLLGYAIRDHMPWGPGKVELF